ncbi:MAG: hypothetical protein ACLFS5_13510, partial [Spirochaetaceae bacterium]
PAPDRGPAPARGWLAVVFVLWGIHKLDYPLLRGLPDAAVWGYGLGALFTMAAGLGLLVAFRESGPVAKRYRIHPR